MKKFFAILFIFALLIAGAVAVFYMTLDENSYKKQIIEATQELTGRTMVINGGVSVKMLPAPTITINDVTIKNIPGSAQPDLLKIEKISAVVKWDSLFKNPLIIEDVTLQNPSFFFERSADGQINWDFPFLKEKSVAPEKDNLIGQSILNVPPQFKNIAIQNGSITYTNATTGLTKSFPKINGRLTASTLNGPFVFDGTFDWMDKPIAINLTTGELFALQNSAVKVILTDRKSQTKIELAGELGNLTQTTDMNGAFTFNIPHISDFLQLTTSNINLSEEMNQPIVGSATFRYTTGKFSFDDIALRFGNEELANSVSGRISYTYQRSKTDKPILDMSLVLSQIDWDSFAPLFADSVTGNLKLNHYFTGNLNAQIKATAITYKKGQLTNTILNLARKNDILTIKELTTTLPDKTTLTASGEMDEDKNTGNFDVSVTATQAQKTLAWLGIEAPTWATFQAVNSVQGKAKLSVRPTDILLDKIDAKIGDGQVRGVIALSRTEPLPNLSLQLTFKNINFDSYLAAPLPTKPQTLPAVWAHVQESLAQSDAFEKANVRLNLTGTDVTLRDVPIGKVTYKGELKNAVLTTQQARIEGAATANLEFSGTVSNANKQLSLNTLQYNFSVTKPSLLMDRLKWESPIAGELTDITLQGTLSGTPNELTLDSSFQFSDAQIKAKGTIKEAKQYDVALDINHPSFHTFMQLFDPNFKVFPQLTGSLTFASTFKGTVKDFVLSDVQAMIGNQRLAGQATVTQGTKQQIKATITTALLYMEKLIPSQNLMTKDTANGQTKWSDELFNFSSLKDLDVDIAATAEKVLFDRTALDMVTTHFVIKDNLLTLSDLKGTWGEGQIRAQASLNIGTAEPVLDLKLAGKGVHTAPDALGLGQFRIKSGAIDFAGDISARGNSLEDMMTSLNGTGALSVTNGVLSGINLPAVENQTKLILNRGLISETPENTLGIQLTTGETPFTSLAATFSLDKGILRSSDMMLQSKTGTAVVQISANLPQGGLSSSAAITMTELEGFPPISVGIKGALSAPQTQVDIGTFARYLENTTTEMRNSAEQERQARIQAQAQMDADGRKAEAVRMAKQAQEMLDETKSLMTLAGTTEGESEFIRAQDAGSILIELSLKPAISVTDLKKIEEQYALLIQRCQQAQKGTSEVASTQMQQQAEKMIADAQKTMNRLAALYQNLPDVPVIQSAYQTGSQMFAIATQTQKQLATSTDLATDKELFAQIKQATDLLTQAYGQVAKFDVTAEVEETSNTTTPTVKGKITRNRSL